LQLQLQLLLQYLKKKLISLCIQTSNNNKIAERIRYPVLFYFRLYYTLLFITYVVFFKNSMYIVCNGATTGTLPSSNQGYGLMHLQTAAPWHLGTLAPWQLGTFLQLQLQLGLTTFTSYLTDIGIAIVICMLPDKASRNHSYRGRVVPATGMERSIAKVKYPACRILTLSLHSLMLGNN
jgi:hypothetical protein